MTTTIITYIHEDLQHEAILVKHKGTSEQLEAKLRKQFEEHEKTITLTDVVIFLMSKSKKYQILENEYFWKESEFRKSEIFKAASQEIEFASDSYFQIYN
ncbi:hypothetical protein WAF17_16210 [Bernardetia sp. ABR2-2B]|uniref:hypothetical protein n=1 Tax=Bernardetia sp. ABR2-2B TaxID=3127472 RepID=UPI0030CFC585